MNIWDLIVKTNDKHFPNWREVPPIYYTNALAGEVGESRNLAKKLAGGGSKPENEFRTIDELYEELADVFIYLVLLSERIDMGEDRFEATVRNKVAKIKERMKGKKKVLSGCLDAE